MIDQASAQSGISTDLTLNEVDESIDNQTLDSIMNQIKELGRLIAMEMKCHSTPIFGCFEFFEVSFTLNSNLNLIFKTIDCSSAAFDSIRTGKDHAVSSAQESFKSITNSKTKITCKNCINHGIKKIIEEGMDIVLKLHKIGWVRVEKKTFKNILTELKSKEIYTFELVYTDGDI